MQRGIERLNQSWNDWAFYRVVPEQLFSIAYGRMKVGEEMPVKIAHRLYVRAGTGERESEHYSICRVSEPSCQ